MWAVGRQPGYNFLKVPEPRGASPDTLVGITKFGGACQPILV